MNRTRIKWIGSALPIILLMLAVLMPLTISVNTTAPTPSPTPSPDNTSLLCPHLSIDGDEHITLFFTSVSGGKQSKESLLTNEGLRWMCEADKAIRKFKGVKQPRDKFRDVCKRDERYTDWKHPDRKNECCASRSIATVGSLSLKYPNDDDFENGSIWDPFSNSEAKFRVNSDCDAITSSDANEIAEILEECSPYFEANVDNLLVQCAAAAQMVDPVKNPNIMSEDYLAAFAKVLECSSEIPTKCLRGDGAGVLDTLLSLLPFETTEALKEGRKPVINMARIMVPVTGNQRAHSDWKKDLMTELDKMYFFSNGKKALGGGDTGVGLMAYNLGIKQDLFAGFIMGDLNYAIAACVLVLIIMWWYTKSLKVTVFAFLEILSSLGLGFFFYCTLFKMPHFPFMNVTTIFLAIGIGADDVFVYVDSWRYSRKEIKRRDEGREPETEWRARRLEYSLRHAGMSTFITSFTTSAAFCANTTTKIISVKCFGLYAGIVILCDYALMITFLPAVVLYYDNSVCGSHSKETEETESRSFGSIGRRSEGEDEEPQPEDETKIQLARRKLAKLADMSRRLLDSFFQDFIPALLLGDFFTCENRSKGEDRKKSMEGYNREWLSAIFWVIALGSIGSYCINVSFVSPGLTLPSSAAFQLFYDTHPFEKWDMEYAPMYTTASVAGVKYYIQWWFGIDGTDDSDSWDPMSAGTTRTYPMDIYEKESQTFFWDFYNEVKGQSWFAYDEQFFIKDVHTMMSGDCNTGWNATVTTESGVFYKCCGHKEFPWEVDNYKECLDFWTRHNGLGSKYQGIYYDTSGKVAAIKLKVRTNVDFSSSNIFTGKWWGEIEAFNDKWIYSSKSLAGTGLSQGWASSQLQLYDVQQSLASGVKKTLRMSLVIASLVLVITTRNIVVSILSMLTITTILGCTIAVLIWDGWHLSILESIVFSVAVGLSVDFCVHYGWALLMAVRENHGIERRPLIVAGLKEMGGSVTMGSVTTVLAGCVMLFCSTMFFLRFGAFLVVCMTFSWFFSTFFLMVCISAVPHTKYLFEMDLRTMLARLGFRKDKFGKGGASVMYELGEEEDDYGQEAIGVYLGQGHNR